MLDMDVRVKVCHVLKRLGAANGFNNGMWDNGYFLISVDLPEGDDRYVQGAIYALVDETPQIEIQIGQRDNEPAKVWFGSRGNSRITVACFDLDQHPNADELAKQWNKLIKRKSRALTEWIQNVSNIWCDAVLEVLPTLVPKIETMHEEYDYNK